MGKWTEWKKIAESTETYLEHLKYDGASCYEHGVKHWTFAFMREVRSVYIGETNNEKKRITQYATDGSHLSETITQHLNDGYMLYYRAQAKKNKREAKKMQDAQLKKYNYEWNVHLNTE